MRCKNCGWENPAEKTACEKCNEPLSGSMMNHETGRRENEGNRQDALHSTISEGSVFPSISEAEEVNKVCANCGYELAAGMKICPACGEPTTKTAASKEKVCPTCGAPLVANARFCAQCGHSLGMGTIGAWGPLQEEFCTLRPIAWANEEVTYNPTTYSGQTIVLNRANTDPNNQTITSKEQAVLTHEDGAWYIEDRSEAKTTLIRVRKKTKLESGDVIALGNRLFEFKG